MIIQIKRFLRAGCRIKLSRLEKNIVEFISCLIFFRNSVFVRSSRWRHFRLFWRHRKWRRVTFAKYESCNLNPSEISRVKCFYILPSHRQVNNKDAYPCPEPCARWVSTARRRAPTSRRCGPRCSTRCRTSTSPSTRSTRSSTQRTTSTSRASESWPRYRPRGSSRRWWDFRLRISFPILPKFLDRD